MAKVNLNSDKEIIDYIDSLLEAEVQKEDRKTIIEKIKYKVIGSTLNVIISGKTFVKKVTKEEIAQAKELIEKYNKLEGKAVSGVSEKLKTKIINFVQAEAAKEQKEREEKISKLKVEKKILKKSVLKETQNEKSNNSSQEKPKLTLAEMQELEKESLKWLKRSDAGYIHPVTGRRWDGETYR